MTALIIVGLISAALTVVVVLPAERERVARLEYRAARVRARTARTIWLAALKLLVLALFLPAAVLVVLYLISTGRS